MTKLRQLTANLKYLANGSSPQFPQMFKQHFAGLAQRPTLTVDVHLKGSRKIDSMPEGHGEKTALEKGLDPETLTVEMLFPEKTPAKEILSIEKKTPLDDQPMVMRSDSGGPAVAAASSGSGTPRID